MLSIKHMQELAGILLDTEGYIRKARQDVEAIIRCVIREEAKKKL